MIVTPGGDVAQIQCRAWLSCALSIMVCGCVAETRDEAVAYRDPAPVAANRDWKLRAGDRVQITVFGEDGISGPYEVSSNGQVRLPLAGVIEADGETTHGLETKVAEALRRRYLRDPKVTVAVLTLRPFYVLGEVEKPGEYPFRTGLNVWRALAVAGGQTYRASADRVLIQHAGERRVASVDLADDVVIEPGDLIRVPERWF